MLRVADNDANVSHKPADAAVAIDGMTCASCVARAEKAARSVAGVSEARVNLARGRAIVRFDPTQTDPEKIAAAITEVGYAAMPEGDAETADAARGEQARHARHAAARKVWARRAAIGLVLWLPLEIVHWIIHLHAGMHGVDPIWLDWAAFIAGSLAIVYVGGGFYAGAWRGLRHGYSNMDTLIALGATVAYVFSLVVFCGQRIAGWPLAVPLYFMEASGLLAIISLGHYLEALARDSAGSAIRQLLELAPAVAHRLRADDGGDAEDVAAGELHPGDRVLIKPGERLPVDGVIVDGIGDIDESMISGEPLPVTRRPGDSVIGGTINQSGRLIVRATNVGSETTLGQIVRLVESAQAGKPPVQQLADRIAAVFVPVVLAIALLTGIGWYAWGRAHGWMPAENWAAIARAVCSVVIIACPCALGLALPAALMVGTGRGAKRGILVRDIDALQRAEQIEIVVLDKTGTLTLGKPVVSGIAPAAGYSAADVLRLAAAAEQFSEHPLASAIVAKAREERLDWPHVESFSSEAGYGVSAQVRREIEGETVVDEILVGNAALMEKYGASGHGKTSDGDVATADTRVYVARRAGDGAAEMHGHRFYAELPGKPPPQPPRPSPGVPGEGEEGGEGGEGGQRQERSVWVEVLGTIYLADQLKPDAAEAIAELRAMNLQLVLLTGDRREAAEAIARQVGIEDVRAGVHPAEKGAVIAELQSAQGRRRRVAMVGDGINDAPALAQADLGIAIGSGSDIARETGGIVLVGGSLRDIAASIRLSRATMRKIRQNLFWAMIYNVVAIPAAALGLLSPLIAAGAMAMSDVTVLGNALLLRRSRIDGGKGSEA